MSTTQTLIINCGASRLTAATFSLNGSELMLDDFVVEELDYDYSIEDEWLGAVVSALSDVVAQKKYQGPAIMIAPGYQLLTKTIKVPHVEAARQSQIIAFEAQQNIPYPLDEVVWDKQVIADDGVETEVLLIAVKSEVINTFCQQVGTTGLSPSEIPAASILDYNAYKLNYADDDEDTLLINIGARSSNLIFINEDGFFIRNIQLGGNALTQNLADNLGKSFSEAEQIKVDYFTGAKSYDEDDPTVQVLESNAEIFERRLSQDVTRSIVNFRRQRSAKAPTRILLMGRGSLLPGLPETLSENQKVSVDYFDPFRSIQTGAALDEDFLKANAYSLSEIIGEAARKSLAEDVSINLLPQSLADEMKFAKQRPLLIAAAAILAVATLPPIFGFMGQAAAYEKATADIQGKATPLNMRHGDILANEEKAKALQNDITDLEDLVNSRSNWIVFFTDLQARLQDVEDVWLENLKLDRDSGNRLNMTGRILITDYDPDDPDASGRAVARRVNNLLRSFTESEFITEVDDIVLVPTRGDDNERIREFRFTLVTNPEKPL